MEGIDEPVTWENMTDADKDACRELGRMISKGFPKTTIYKDFLKAAKRWEIERKRGRQEGWEKGREEGREVGREEGRTAELRSQLEQAIKRQSSEPDQDLLAIIESATVEEMAGWVQRVMAGETLVDALRAGDP